jgi:hypothetical protein
MTKHLFFILIILLLISGISCKSLGIKKNEVSSLETNFMGLKLQAIKNAKAIVFYSIDPIRKPSVGEETFQEYGLKKSPIVLSQNEAHPIIETLEKIISSKYDERLVKSCSFIPDFGLAFYTPLEEERTEPVNLLISFYCDQVMINRDSTNIFKTFEQSTKSTLEDLFHAIQQSN